MKAMAEALFGVNKAFIGMVHLPPLPGSPRWPGDIKAVLAEARHDALVLAEGGVDALIVENFGDAPFNPRSVGPETVAAMTAAVQTVKDSVDIPIGINVLRNDPRAALAIAVVTGASFVRANVHYGVMVADEGLVKGRAHETLRYRHNLQADEKIKIFADVLVKHAEPLVSVDIVHVARETVQRGLADVLIVTGPATGSAMATEHVSTVKEAVPAVPVLVGSGLDESNAAELLAIADGAIVGTSLKVDGVVHNPVDPARVKRMAQLFSK